MKTRIKTVDVIALEWFDKINGNSYFSMEITINYQMKNEIHFSVPIQGGYEDHYKCEALNELIKRGYLPASPQSFSFWRYYKDKNIIARHTKHVNCKKKELYKG